MKTNRLAELAEQYIDHLIKTRENTSDGHWDWKQHFTEEVKKEDFTDMTDIVKKLPGISLPEGYVVEYIHPDRRGTGGVCHIFAREMSIPHVDLMELHEIYRLRAFYCKSDKKPQLPEGYLEPMEAFTVQNTEDGIWSAFLLSESYRFLPLHWHAKYFHQFWLINTSELIGYIPLSTANSRELIVMLEKELKKTDRYEDADEINACLKKLRQDISNEFNDYFTEGIANVSIIPSLVGNTSLLPSVTKLDENTWKISYTSWSNWNGLVKTTWTASWKDGKVKFHDHHDDDLIHYRPRKRL